MMAGQSLGLLALLVLNPLIQESHGTWSLYEKFFFAPRGLPPNPEQTSNCSSDDPDTCNPEGNQEEGNARDRGSKSSPDPEADAEWIWWAIRIWWISIGKLADTGLVWCGTLCASVGVAAQWSYWLLVAIVGVFLFQLLIWTVTWVLCPFWRHSRALLRYLCGRGGWHEVAHLHQTAMDGAQGARCLDRGVRPTGRQGSRAQPGTTRSVDH